MNNSWKNNNILKYLRENQLIDAETLNFYKRGFPEDRRIIDDAIKKGNPIKVSSNNTLRKLIVRSIKLLGSNANLNFIDVSNVKDFSQIFKVGTYDPTSDDKILSNFNGDISKWDTSNARYMSYLFENSPFNGDLSKWDVSNVINFSGCFYGSAFNNNSIENWDVGNAWYMPFMFAKSQFNHDISKWNISNVSNISFMFANSKFNQDISNWNISNVKKMNNIFSNCSFNQNIDKWNLSPEIKEKAFKFSSLLEDYF